MRRLVSHGFTPRTIGELEAELDTRATALVDALVARGGGDLVADLAGELPLQAICILLGVPETDRHRVFRWVEYSFDFRDRGAFHEAVTNEIADLLAETMKPRFLRLAAHFNVRGGIYTTVVAEHRQPGWSAPPPVTLP